MKKLFSFALLFALVLAFSGVCFAGDGSDYRQLQETGVFYNYSGRTLSAGDVVILDTTADATTGTTLGAYVTTAPSVDDSILVIGVVQESQTSVLSGTPVVVVTKGPVETYIADSSDAVTINTAVGTTSTAGYTWMAGGGTNLGIALEAGDGTDGDKVIVWVQPTGAD